MAERLSSDEIESRLQSLEQWEYRDNKLHREYVFPDFIEAMGFMVRAAIVAQAMNHHPEWSNVYKSVTVDLTSHDAGGVTELDFQLAHRMEELSNA